MQAGRPVGTTQDGTSNSDDAPGTDAAADRFVDGLSGGRLPRAVVSCGGRFERPGAGGGHSRRPFVGTAACPARDIAAWRAFYPGRGEGPRNRAERGRRRRERGQAVRATRRRRWRPRPRRRRRRRRRFASCAPAADTGVIMRRSRAAWNRSGNGGPLPVHQPFAQNPCIVTVGSTTRCTTP
ncbi:hypothetical protein FCJ61_38910 [Burkholderia metallica]|nr:hypothetical protein [Burkholderia metallica]